MAAATKSAKTIVGVAMSVELARLLRQERANTGKPVNRIIEGLVREYYAKKSRKPSSN